MGMDATKLIGGSNERPCQFVKRLEVIGKFVITHKLRKTGERGRARTELRMELSPRAEFHAQSVHSYMPRQKGEKEQALAAVSQIYRYQGIALYVHSRTVLAMRFNGPIRWDI